MDADSNVEITIDDQNRIRILDVDVYKESDHLRNDCLELIKKVVQFEGMSSGILEAIENLAKKVDSQKLKALSEKSRLDGIDETKRKRMLDLAKQLNEKDAEFERYDGELQSLVKIEQEQRMLIEKLINNKMT